MASTYDVPGLLARQDVATAVLVPYLTGLVVQVLLIGVFFGLFASYAGDLGKRARAVKAVSWVVFALVLCCLGVACEEIVDTAVSQNRTSEALFAGPPQSNVLPILAGLTGAVCQAFLMVRAAALVPSKSARWAFYIPTSAAILLALTGSALFSAAGFVISDEEAFALNYFTAEAIWLWSSAGADLLISLALAYTLHRRIAGFNARTDGVLRRLSVVALQTAAYTSIISIAGAAVATAFEGSEDYHTSTVGFAFWLPLPALHAISLYTTLSSRRALQATLSAAAPGDALSLPSGRRRACTGATAAGMGTGSRRSLHHAGTGTGTGSGAALEVRVEREQTVSYDAPDGDGWDDLEKGDGGRRGRRARALEEEEKQEESKEKAYDEL
ncbi:hypothetical protein JCM10450v2_001053 [Rhodotorula kratochvilovae]